MAEEFDSYKYELLSEKKLGLILRNPYPNVGIIYKTSDGKEFNNKALAERHERIVSRERYYNHLLQNRNWFQRFFNIKPSMSFYDKLESRINQ